MHTTEQGLTKDATTKLRDYLQNTQLEVTKYNNSAMTTTNLLCVLKVNQLTQFTFRFI